MVPVSPTAFVKEEQEEVTGLSPDSSFPVFPVQLKPLLNCVLGSSAPWGRRGKKLLNCEQITKPHVYVRSVVDLHPSLPVQGSCPHLFTLLKALSLQVYTLVFALAYLLCYFLPFPFLHEAFILFLFSLFIFFFPMNQSEPIFLPVCSSLQTFEIDSCSEKHFRCSCHTECQLSF